MMAEPLRHISRRCPPWREPTQTECGRELADTRGWLSRDEAKGLIRKHGIQRAAFMLCMTCWHTSDRYRDWNISPSDVVAREGSSKWSVTGPSLIDRELFALAAMVEAHPEEFAEYLAGLAETSSLDARRHAKRSQR